MKTLGESVSNLAAAVDAVKDAICQSIVPAIPKRLAYWVAIRVLAGSTFPDYATWLEQMSAARIALDEWRASGNDDNWPEYKGRFKWRKQGE